MLRVLVLSLALVAPALAGEELPHGNYEGDCARCHDDAGWKPARIAPEFRRDEHAFPLRAAHDLADCRACHRSLDFTEADAACVACHADPHRSELGLDCAQCHTPRTFIDRRLMQQNHQRTRFPLRGSHRALDCEDCHALTPPGALQWVNTPVACVACHRDAYDATDSPDHAAEGFPTDCERCHPVTVWEAARFDHSTITQPCVDCHLDDYQATTDPDHEASGFPTACQDCHGTTTWDGARYTAHDTAFPIYSGRHRGEWSACSDCHVVPGSFATFTCFEGCHEHGDEAEVTNRHDGVDGFVYQSDACYACHPRGDQ